MTGSVIDAEQLANLLDVMDGDTDLVIEVIDLFLEDAPGRIAGVVTAFDRGDADALMRAAHSLKGSAANVGAKGLTGLCANLERRGRKASLAGAAGLCVSLQREFEVVRSALTSERERLRARSDDAADSRVAL